MKMKKTLATMLAAASVMSVGVVPAMAMEYNYTSGQYNGFYQSTSVTADAISNSGTIVVGSDGTIAANTTENVSSRPLASFTLPVGEYPDSWGKETDVAIAQNSIFPNVLAPTTQMSNVAAPVKYDTGRINSPALPTPNTSSALTGGSYVRSSGTYGNGYMMGVTTKEVPMDKITTDGAIGLVSIPSMGFSEYVYDGATTSNMQKGLAHFEETAGWEGNVAMAGHNRGSYGIFQNLNALKVGDVIKYTTAYGEKQYKVVSIGTCATTDVSGLLQDGTNKLTLYTCVANRPEIKRMIVATQI